MGGKRFVGRVERLRRMSKMPRQTCRVEFVACPKNKRAAAGKKEPPVAGRPLVQVKFGWLVQMVGSLFRARRSVVLEEREEVTHIDEQVTVDVTRTCIRISQPPGKLAPASKFNPSGSMQPTMRQDPSSDVAEDRSCKRAHSCSLRTHTNRRRQRRSGCSSWRHTGAACVQARTVVFLRCLVVV